MAKAKKLPSGSWRVNQYVGKDENGKRIYKSFTASTKKEAEFIAAEYVMKARHSKVPQNITLGEAMERYIESKSNILSPSTLKTYNGIKRNGLNDIKNVLLKDLTRELIQKAINNESMNHSPKTVKNIHGLLSATLKEFYPDFVLTTKLPSKIKNELYIPDSKTVSFILEKSKNDQDLHLAILLAAFLGFRRSEICALTWKDVNFNESLVTVSKAIVIDESKNWVEKAPKSFSGNRKIPLPDVVANELLKYKKTTGKIITCTPNNISDNFRNLLKHLDVPHFRFHDLRHYNASIMLAFGIPDKYAMEIMGHATNNMLKNVYQHTFEEKQNQVAKDLNVYFSEIMQHEN